MIKKYKVLIYFLTFFLIKFIHRTKKRFIMKKNKVYIPIGIDCSASHYLRSNDMRKQAFPFDWNVTPISIAIELIKNNFDGFLELQNLEFLPPVKRLLFEEDGINLKSTNDIITPVVCHKYGILFPHDFSEAGIEDYTKVKSKYERRIANMLRLIDEQNKIEFIYHIGEPNKWQLEQYKLTGKNFKRTTKTEVIKEFKNLQLKNAKITSLKQLKMNKMTLIRRYIYLYSQFKK